MKNAVIYARHLTYRKNEPNIDEQIKICKDFANENEFEITDCYTDCFDEKKLVYPAFEQLNSKSRKEIPNAIIVYSIVALGRNSQKTRNWMNSLHKKGIEIYFVDYKKSEDGHILRLLEEYRRNL